jgi:signal transduction histidine kinase
VPLNPLMVRIIWCGMALGAGALVGLGLPGVAQRTDANGVWWAAINLVVVAVFAAASGLLVWRRPTDRVAVFAAFALLLFGAITFPDFGDQAVRRVPALWLPKVVLDEVGRTAFTAFLFVFPDGRFVPRWIRWPALVWILGQLPRPFLLGDDIAELRTTYDYAVVPLFIVGFGCIVFSQVYRYRRVSTPLQRLQTRWTAVGFVAAVTIFGVVGVLQGFIAELREPLPGLLLTALADLGIALIPLSLAVALLRHGLFDVDALIGRALVYGALTVTVVVVYMLLVGYLGSLFRTQDNLFISLLATGAIALLVQPVRERLQRGVNRLLYGQRDEPYAVLSDLGRRLATTADPTAMLPAVAETISRALKLPYVAIEVADGAPTPLAAVGVVRADPIRLPLVHQGETLGTLLLGRRTRGEGLSSADRRLVDDLVRQAAAALAAVRLNSELQRSRERLVNAREEERRRIRRDLHDGLGPTLAALGLKLETARNRLSDDPRADALLGELAERTQAAVGDIRRLVYALRPPALDELGLLGALRHLADGLEGQQLNGLKVSVDATVPLPALPAAVEVAVYRIAQEALTNVARHAHASSARVALSTSDAGLCISVEDDGVGLPVEHHAGVGLRSMRERAEELGGVCLIERGASGGACVVATVPLRESEMLR